MAAQNIIRIPKKVSYQIVGIALLLFPTLLNAQTVRGTVTDELTGKPLEKVSIYFDGTFQGTVSDSSGNFVLNNTLKTSSPLVVSSVGYQSQKISNYGGDANLKIALKSKVIELAEITIGGDAISRTKAMKIFLKEFIGEVTKDCVIENPDEIYFRYNKKDDLLTADADKPLIITNKRLGYKITFFLTSFANDPLQTQYKGNYFFTEDIAGLKPAKVKAVMKARDDAYYGSRMHFVRALWADELEKNGFSVYRTPRGRVGNTNTYNLRAANVVGFDDIVQVADRQKFIMLAKGAGANNDTLNGNEVFVTYKNGKDSFLRQEDGYTGVLIDKNGFYDEGLEWKGSISIDRISTLLPFEFMPSK